MHKEVHMSELKQYWYLKASSTKNYSEVLSFGSIRFYIINTRFTSKQNV